MQYQGKTNEYLKLANITVDNGHVLKEVIESSLTLLWFESDNNVMVIDGVTHRFSKNQMVALTEFHNIEIKNIAEAKLLRFNRSFYCILDHDNEVGCKGILFFGASQLPIINVPEKELEVLKTVWQMFLMEMESKDELQLSMLQMMLKRFLILCTRLYKKQKQYPTTKINADIVREYNFLVEQNFKNIHNVTEYAKLLNKSPKTLANVFSKMGGKTPLQYIQDRIMLEARRLLRYTDKGVSEIGYELGYEDLQTFSRFFKKQEGVPPSEFREKA